MNEAQESDIRKAKGHCRVALVILRNSQPSLNLRGMVSRIYEEAIEATPEPEGMGHQGAVVEGYGTIE